MADRETAEALFSELRDLIKRLDEVITQILDTEAWRHIGYESFGECFKAELAHVPFRGKRLCNRVAIELAKDESFDPDEAEMEYRGFMIRPQMVIDAREDLAAGRTEGDIRTITIGKWGPNTIGFERREREMRERLECDQIARERKAIEDEKPVRRRATGADLPSKQYRITVEFTEAEVDRFRLIAAASFTDLNRAAEQGIRNHFARLESELKVSI